MMGGEGKEEVPGDGEWHLVHCMNASVTTSYPHFPLVPHTMVFVGREECDLTLKSRSVDKRHAVIKFDCKERKFQVKDLNSSNGTFVNEIRIPGQTYVWLESMDRLRFGYDSTTYQVQKLVKSFSEGASRPEINRTATITAPASDEVASVSKNSQVLSNGSNHFPSSAIQFPLKHSSSEGVLTQKSPTNGCHFTTHKHHTQFPSTLTEHTMEPDSLQLEDSNGDKVPSEIVPQNRLGQANESLSHTRNVNQRSVIPTHLGGSAQCLLGNSGQGVSECREPVVMSGSGAIASEGSDKMDPSAVTELKETVSESEMKRRLSVPNLQASTSMGSIHSAFSEDSLTGTEMTTPITELMHDCPINDHPPSAVPGSSSSPSSSQHHRLHVVPRGSSLDGQQRERWTSGGHRRGAMNSSALYGPPDWWEAHKLTPSNGELSSRCLSKSKSADRVPFVRDRDNLQVFRDERGICHRENAVVMDPSPELESFEREGTWGAVTTSSSSSASASKTPPSPPLQPMAFTVDLTSGQDSDPDSRAEGKRRLDIGDSISKFAPRHRRNHSNPKSEEDKAKGEKEHKVELKETSRPICQSPAVIRKSFASRKAGYHSEGYFSSDQEEDISVKSDLSVKKNKNVDKGLRSTLSNPLDKTMADQKGRSALMGEMHAFGRSLEESASHFISKVLGSSPEKRKEPMRSASVGNEPLEMENVCDVGASGDEGEEAHSEAGTYTIDKECPEEEKARKEIDQVFGVTGDGVENGRTPGHDEKTKLSTQRGSPNWIREWAAQVAEQHQQRAIAKPPEKTIQPKNKASTPTGTRSSEPQSPLAAPSGPPRPRRRLPSLPTDQVPFTLSSPLNADPTTTTNTSVAPHSDSNLETESFLRDTESVVTAMQARMTRSFTGSLMSAPSPSFDSPQQDVEDIEPSADSDPGSCTGNEFSGRVRASRNGILGRSSFRQEVGKSDTDPGTKSLSAQLRAKLRLLENSVRSPSESPTSSEKIDSVKRVGIERRVSQPEEEESEKSQDATNDSATMSAANATHQTRYNRAFRCMPANYFDMRCMEDLSEVRSTAMDSDCMRRQAISGLRRGRLGVDELPSPVAPARKKPSALPTPTHLSNTRSTPRGRGVGMPSALSRSSSTSSAFNRADGGRFSLRVPKGTTQSTGGLPPKPRPSSGKTRGGESSGVGAPANVSTSKRGRGSGNHPGRSNSTLSSREVEFQNWKRRKSYDPMKAAAEGKKKREEARKAASGTCNSNAQAPMSPSSPTSAQALDRSTLVISEASSRNSSPPNPLLRSASFHGTPGSEGATSDEEDEEEEEEEETLSMEEGEESPAAVVSPTSAAASALLMSRSMAYHRTKAALSQRAATAPSPDLVLSSSRKSSLDETLDIGLSFLRSTTPNSSMRGRAKLEALDNLVIAAIYGFSNKIKGSSYNLLKKLRRLYEGDVEKCEVLSEVINLLEEGDTSSVSSPSKSPSKELSGTLKNLKKLENVFAALDEVLLGDEDVESSDAEGEKAVSF